MAWRRKGCTPKLPNHLLLDHMPRACARKNATRSEAESHEHERDNVIAVGVANIAKHSFNLGGARWQVPLQEHSGLQVDVHG
jgi:hypothetical protein